MLDFSDVNIRIHVLCGMQEVVNSEQKAFSQRLREKVLTPEEVVVQDFVDSLAFKEGAWYRPSHNIMVPAACAAIVRDENAARDLVYAAQLHDTGYAFLRIGSNLAGPDWQNVDARIRHMNLGKVCTQHYLSMLSEMGVINLSQDRIGRLANIVGTHDNPYLQIPLKARDKKILRSADRTFVPSALSWYKDFFSYLSSEEHLKGTHELGIELNPRTFFGIRVAAFYEDDNPIGEISVDRRLRGFNTEGCEPSYTLTESMIVDSMFRSRWEELAALSEIEYPDEFLGMFEAAYFSEMDKVLYLAAKK